MYTDSRGVEAQLEMAMLSQQAHLKTCLTRLQDGKPVTSKDIKLEIYRLLASGAVSASTGTVDTAAVDLAKALGQLQHSR
jgi:hypothetical protein